MKGGGCRYNKYTELKRRKRLRVANLQNGRHNDKKNFKYNDSDFNTRSNFYEQKKWPGRPTVGQPPD